MYLKLQSQSPTQSPAHVQTKINLDVNRPIVNEVRQVSTQQVAAPTYT